MPCTARTPRRTRASRSRTSSRRARSRRPRAEAEPMGEIGAAMDTEQDRVLIEAAFADRGRLKDAAHVAAVERTLARLDRGELRVASPPASDDGEWTTHAWTKQ